MPGSSADGKLSPMASLTFTLPALATASAARRAKSAARRKARSACLPPIFSDTKWSAWCMPSSKASAVARSLSLADIGSALVGTSTFTAAEEELLLTIWPSSTITTSTLGANLRDSGLGRRSGARMEPPPRSSLTSCGDGTGVALAELVKPLTARGLEFLQ